MDNKHNMETLQNKYPISMYQGEPFYKLYFIATDNWEQVSGAVHTGVEVHKMDLEMCRLVK